MTVYIEILAEYAFNTLMCIYLIQPYREAKAEHRDFARPSEAVQVIAGRTTNRVTEINTNEFSTFEQVRNASTSLNNLDKSAESNNFDGTERPSRKQTCNFASNPLETMTESEEE